MSAETSAADTPQTFKAVRAQDDFFAAQGLHGLQGFFFAAQGLHAPQPPPAVFLAAQGL